MHDDTHLFPFELGSFEADYLRPIGSDGAQSAPGMGCPPEAIPVGDIPFGSGMSSCDDIEELLLQGAPSAPNPTWPACSLLEGEQGFFGAVDEGAPETEGITAPLPLFAKGPDSLRLTTDNTQLQLVGDSPLHVRGQRVCLGADQALPQPSSRPGAAVASSSPQGFGSTSVGTTLPLGPLVKEYSPLSIHSTVGGRTATVSQSSPSCIAAPRMPDIVPCTASLEQAQANLQLANEALLSYQALVHGLDTQLFRIAGYPLPLLQFRLRLSAFVSHNVAAPSHYCICLPSYIFLCVPRPNNLTPIKTWQQNRAESIFLGILAHFGSLAAYFGTNFGIIPSHFRVILRPSLLLQHISGHFWFFQTFLGRT